MIRLLSLKGWLWVNYQKRQGVSIKVWRTGRSSPPFISRYRNDFKPWAVCKELDFWAEQLVIFHEKFTQKIVTLWANCSAWLKAIHKAVFQSSCSTNSFVRSYLSEMQALATLKITTSRVGRGTYHCWLPPLGNLVKVNVDGVVGEVLSEPDADITQHLIWVLRLSFPME